MAREFHNLAGWSRDVRKAIDGGLTEAYEAAELIDELLDLVSPDGEPMLGDDSQLDTPSSDGGEGLDDGSSQHQVERPRSVDNAIRGQRPIQGGQDVRPARAVAGAHGVTYATPVRTRVTRG